MDVHPFEKEYDAVVVTASFRGQTARRAFTDVPAADTESFKVDLALALLTHGAFVHRIVTVSQRKVQRRDPKELAIEWQSTANEKEQKEGAIPDLTLRDARRSFERMYITRVLERCSWRIPQTAKILGIQRPNLYRKMRILGIVSPRHHLKTA